MGEHEQRIRGFLADNFVLGDGGVDIRRDDSLMSLGLIDSTGVLELVAFLDEAFSIQISDDELVPENLDSIGNLVDFIQRKGAPT